MSLLASAFGGALQGYGKGIENVAVTQRNEALENMRQKYQTQRDEATATRADARQERQNQFQTTRDETQQKYDIEKLEKGGDIDAGKIKLQAQTSAQQAKLVAGLQGANTRAEITLRDQLDSGEVKSTFRGEDGTIYGMFKDGSVKSTGVKGAPTAAETSNTGGGAMSEFDITSAYDDDYGEWSKAGRKGREPKKSDYIGKTRAEYLAGKGGGSSTLTAPAAAGIALSPADWDEAKADAGRRFANGDDAFRGMTQEQAIAKVRAGLISRGYRVPNG